MDEQPFSCRIPVFVFVFEFVLFRRQTFRFLPRVCFFFVLCPMSAFSPPRCPLFPLTADAWLLTYFPCMYPNGAFLRTNNLPRCCLTITARGFILLPPTSTHFLHPSPDIPPSKATSPHRSPKLFCFFLSDAPNNTCSPPDPLAHLFCYGVTSIFWTFFLPIFVSLLFLTFFSDIIFLFFFCTYVRTYVRRRR